MIGALALLGSLAAAMPASAAPEATAASRGATAETTFAPESIKSRPGNIDVAEAERLATQWMNAKMAGRPVPTAGTIALQPPSTGRATRAVIVCSAVSALNAVPDPAVPIFNAVATSSTSCPAPIDSVGVVSTLQKCFPELAKCFIVAQSPPEVQQPFPATSVMARAEAFCSTDELYVTVGFHNARLGTQVRTATSFSAGPTKLCPSNGL